VELYAEALDGGAPLRQTMAREGEVEPPGSGFVYGGQVPASRPALDYTPRLVPRHALAQVPLEASWILWQR